MLFECLPFAVQYRTDVNLRIVSVDYVKFLKQAAGFSDFMVLLIIQTPAAPACMADFQLLPSMPPMA